MTSVLAQMAEEFDRTDGIKFQEKMVMLGMRGLSLKECGDYFGLDPDDWIEWCKEHPIAEARHKAGKARGIALAGQRLLEQIKEGKINAITFYLKTQGNFTERSVMQIEDAQKNVRIPLPAMPIDPTEAANVYREFMKSS